jgi:hypothetical protein
MSACVLMNIGPLTSRRAKSRCIAAACKRVGLSAQVYISSVF